MNNKKMRNAFIRVSAKNVIHVNDEKNGVKDGDIVRYSKEDLIEVLQEWEKTKDIKYYLIEHNHDKENVHFHIVIDFPKKSQAAFTTIKNKFPFGSIEKCKFGVKSCVQYLVHLNEKNKERYEWDEIITNAPNKLEDYKIPGPKNESAELNDLIDKILVGGIKRYEIAKIPAHLYIRYRTKIDNAFDYYKKLQASKFRNINIYVLQGATGLGKSTFCKKWAEDNNQSICFSSASNDPWQDYEEQDIFVYDDFIPSKIDLEDFMKSINPHISSTAKSRYNNKVFIGNTIFIATNIPITEWFMFVDKNRRDAFFRRIEKVLQFEKDPNQDGVTQILIHHFSEDFNSLIFDRRAEFDLQKYISSFENKKNVDFDDQFDKIVNF